MNKKILKTVKIILWGLVYTLPILQFLISVRTDPTISFEAIMVTYVSYDNFISDTINKVFASAEGIKLFVNHSAVVYYFAYFVCVSFAHICVDVILFLPDCARYIFDNMVGSKDEDSL